MKYNEYINENKKKRKKLEEGNGGQNEDVMEIIHDIVQHKEKKEDLKMKKENEEVEDK